MEETKETPGPRVELQVEPAVAEAAEVGAETAATTTTADVVSKSKTMKTMKAKPTTTKSTPFKRGLGIYILHIIHRKVALPFIRVGSNIKELLQKKIAREIEGRCTIEGYIKPNSVRVLTYTSGVLVSSDVVFDVALECLVCNPVEGMNMRVVVENITKAGIRASTGGNKDGEKSPVDVFIARDHHFNNKYFSKVNIGDEITIRVIGQRYEINDDKISIIAELVSTSTSTTTRTKR
jgi:DNA-directed RNA polymerase subunit E'/Rpb7